MNWSDGTQGVYLHMLAVDGRVRPGRIVSVGQYLGESNDTGHSQGPHLHYTEWNNQDDERPDGASSHPANFNDPEETHDSCGDEEGDDDYA